MYKIGCPHRPGELEDSDYWTLDIDYEQEDRDALKPHGAIIQIHGDSLSVCMLKAKFICDLLNVNEFHGAEIFTQLMELAKVMQIQHMESKEGEDDAESNS